MTSCAAVEAEVRALVRERGRITFAQYMQACLYSPRGGFFASRAERIDAHFGTSATSHPVFGALVARQLGEMWRLLGSPDAFDVIEVGSGDGSLARAVVQACARIDAPFARALRYVAVDYAPHWPASADRFQAEGSAPDAAAAAQARDATPRVHRVKAAGLAAFRNVVGCILSNELIDNFPVHRFAIEQGRVREIYVALDGGQLVELLGEPSCADIEERLASLGVPLAEGCRGEVNLRLEAWTRELACALDRGFVLTIDYGGEAGELYSPANYEGTLVCYYRHAAGNDPYRHIGQQDITCHVDFTALRRLGEQRGLVTLGYARQRELLANLGFSAQLEALDTRGLSAARRALERMAMTALVDPEQYGDLRVLAQAKGVEPGIKLSGFA